MTEQQQKLYDKLLKKVNEYCLGAAAEDVIAAIDALVDDYECSGQTLSKALHVICSKHVDMQWLSLQFSGADLKDLTKYLRRHYLLAADERLTKEEIALIKEIYDESIN